MGEFTEDLKGKRIVIGGAKPGGMGGALAIRLVEAGAQLVVGDVSEEGLKALASDLQGKAGKAVTMPFDMANDDSIKRLVQRTIDEMGGIDGLAIPAADLSEATLGNDKTVLDTEVHIWERTFRVNVIGHAQLMRAAIPHMIKGGGGSIVVVSSDASHLGMEVMPCYSSSKAALQALVRHVARLCGKDKIRCNGICPGLVMTEGGKVNMSKEDRDGPPRNVLQRHGDPDDIARVMTFLLSDASSWITGQTVSANGGVAFRD